MKLSLRVIVLSAVFWLGLGTGTVNAASYHLGTINSSGTSQIFNVGSGVFFDEVDFEIPTKGFGGTAGSISVFFENTQFLGINPLSVELFAGINDGVNATTNPIGTFTQVSQGTLFSISSSLLSSGFYHFEIEGNAIGSNGGAYLISISPVPEPETYAMLLIGLGLVAFAARRRKNDISH